MKRRVTLLERLSGSGSGPAPLGVQVYGVVDGVEILLDEWSDTGEHIYHLGVSEQVGEVQRILESKEDECIR